MAQKPYGTRLEGVQKRAQATRDDIAQAIDALPAQVEAAGRLTEYANFYASLDAAIAVALDELVTRPHGQPQPRAAQKDTVHD